MLVWHAEVHLAHQGRRGPPRDDRQGPTTLARQRMPWPAVANQPARAGRCLYGTVPIMLRPARAAFARLWSGPVDHPPQLRLEWRLIFGPRGGVGGLPHPAALSP